VSAAREKVATAVDFLRNPQVHAVAIRRARLQLARAGLFVAEVIAPDTISGTSRHVETGEPQCYVLTIGTSVEECVAALHHAAEQAKAEVFGIRVPVSIPFDDDEEMWP
jgi:hypothetical protein